MTFTGKIVGAEMCPGDRTLIHVEVPGYHPIQMSGECVLTIGAPSTPAPATHDRCTICGRPGNPQTEEWSHLGCKGAAYRAAEAAAPSPVEETKP